MGACPQIKFQMEMRCNPGIKMDFDLNAPDVENAAQEHLATFGSLLRKRKHWLPICKYLSKSLSKNIHVALETAYRSLKEKTKGIMTAFF